MKFHLHVLCIKLLNFNKFDALHYEIYYYNNQMILTLCAQSSQMCKPETCQVKYLCNSLQILNNVEAISLVAPDLKLWDVLCKNYSPLALTYQLLYSDASCSTRWPNKMRDQTSICHKWWVHGWSSSVSTGGGGLSSSLFIIYCIGTKKRSEMLQNETSEDFRRKKKKSERMT